MKTTIAALAAFTLFPLVSLVATEKDEAFEKIAKDYIEGLLQTHPEYATELGDHRFDDRLTDYSDGAVAKELGRAKEVRHQLEQFSDLTQLTGPNKVDVRLLKDNIDNEIFGIEDLKEREWDPLVYMQSLANSLYLIEARDFAPAPERAASLRKRMEAIPAVIAQAKANLKNPPRVYTETAIDQVQGAISLVNDGLKEVLDQAPDAKKEIAPVQQKTAAALTEYKEWLQKDLLPRSNADFRIGGDKFRKKLRFALASEMSMEDLMQHARADL